MRLQAHSSLVTQPCASTDGRDLETMDTAGVANPKKSKEKGGAEKVRGKKIGS